MVQLGNRLRIEARAGIAHNNQKAALLVAGYQALDNFCGIFLGAVHDCVGQRFLQGQFDGVFLALDIFHLANGFHHLRHDGIDGLAVRRQRDAHAQVKFGWIEIVFGKVFLGRSPRFHGWPVGPLSARLLVVATAGLSEF